MGSSLAAGLLAAPWCAPHELAILARSIETRQELERHFPGVGVYASIELAEVDANTGAVLCVKPDQAESAARSVGTS